MPSIIDEINRHQNVKKLTPATDEDIMAAERALNVSFSQEYKLYTSTYGAVCMDDLELTGAVGSKAVNVVPVTQSARTITPLSEPDWYVVHDPHVDGIIYWQDSSGKIIRTYPHAEKQVVADSMAQFISMQHGN